jgi:hypothetical protein
MMARRALTILLIPAVVMPALAQDIRGIENCTAEKNMERRTSCLQSNIDFLQQALARQRRETRAQLDAMTHAASMQKAEIEALRGALTKLERELTELRKGQPAKK